MWVHSNPLMSHAGVTFISPPVVTPPPVAKSVSFTGYITMLWVRPLEMCLDPYKNWIQVDPVFEFLKLLLCCDVALSSPIWHWPDFFGDDCRSRNTKSGDFKELGLGLDQICLRIFPHIL